MSENQATNSTNTVLGQALNEANINPEDFPESKNKARVIIQNSDGEKLIRSRKSESLRMLRNIKSEIDTLEDYIQETPNDAFFGIYRSRKDAHPITIDTEMRHRLTVLQKTVEKVLGMYRLEGMDFSSSE